MKGLARMPRKRARRVLAGDWNRNVDVYSMRSADRTTVRCISSGAHNVSETRDLDLCDTSVVDLTQTRE